MKLLDLRQFIDEVDGTGDLKRVEGADPDNEIGAITEVASQLPDPPMLLFDKINGYPEGYRIVSNVFESPKRMALTVGLPTSLKGIEFARTWKKRMHEFSPIPPREVTDGPIFENKIQGDDVDITKFPAPKWHEFDGGRFIGTGCMVIAKDPDDGWVNLGSYRNQVFDSKTIGCNSGATRHLGRIVRKYWAKNENCPVVITFGQEPSLYLPSAQFNPWGTSELDYAGWIRGAPVEVIPGPLTGLPIPATAEIAIEGEIPPLEVESHDEGPFGEYPGYYTAESKTNQVVKIKAIYHRNDPIVWGFPPLKPPSFIRYNAPFLSALLWDTLDRAGVPGVQGVWALDSSATMITVVSIKQMYSGHVGQVGHIAAAAPGRSVTKYIIVVDEDIDPSDIDQVVWAVATRSDPGTSLLPVHGVPCGAIDPRMSPEKRQKRELTNTVGIIDACKPFQWKDKFPLTNEFSKEKKAEIIQKWGSVIGV